MPHFATTSRLRAFVAASMVAVVAVLPLTAPRAGAADSGSLLTWNHLAPSAAPPGRLHAAVALDVANGTTVLFGGRSGGQVLNDTWSWDGSTWTPHNPTTSPPPLESASMAYDNIGHRILLFGGVAGDGTATNATWSWDGGNWTLLAPAATPPIRYGASIASDSITGTDVLFGGESTPGTPVGDTWSWDGTNWSQVSTAATPSARAFAAMTFDAARGVVVMFGGTTGADAVADTWTFDGKNWNRQAPGTSPPPRVDAALGFDTATESSVLYGGASGNSVLGDTWLWNGSTWSTSLPLSLLPNLNPPARSGAAMAAGPGSHRLVLFGGQSGGTVAFTLGDTWNVATLATGPAPTTPTTTPGSIGGPSTTQPAATTTTVVKATTTSGPPSSTPSSRAPAPRAPLKVTSQSVRGGQQVTVSGSGFVPGTMVTITFHSATLHSTPVIVGTIKADAEGRFTATVSVPGDLSPGPHNIEAAGTASSGGQAVLVAQVRITAPASHNRWLLPVFMIALTVLLAVGAGAVLTASTRWHPFSSQPRP